MTHSRITGLLFICLLVFGVAASAQTTGSIRGEIRDQESLPLPGVVVTIRSEALIGQTRTATTNELGVFRFPSLPVGAYSVEGSMSGFQNVVADNIRVSLGATANVPLTMKMNVMAEAVTVEAESPLLDVNQSGLSTSYDKEILEEVPTQRGMWDLMQVSPGATVDAGDSQSARVIAFGSNRQSNSWNIDGVDATAPETGDAWWYINPDMIEEIQVLGVGAPAEYGNFTGAALNVVTKTGSNSFHGTANYFFQAEGLTGVNVRLADSPYVFNRDVYADVTGQLGGPILKDRVWFFGAVEILRDSSTTPGVNPDFAPTLKSDKYDLKITTRIGEKSQLTGFYHDEIYEYPDTTSQFIAESAAGNEIGSNPAWGASLTSTLTENLLLELNYSGWWSEDRYQSQTDSLANPFVQYYDVGPTTYSGGLTYPYDYTTSRQQVNGKATYYADNFLKSQHEFRFGVQYSHGNADTISGYGANGVYEYTYTYNYYGTNYTTYYQIQQQPFHYGGISNDLGFFLDDTVTVNDKLTLNLGVRFDLNRASFPEFPEVVNGTPSITPVANWVETDTTLPGINDFINWNTVSPRLGFVWQPRGDGRSIIQGSFGVYYDHNVIGNWDVPPPGFPPIRTYELNPESGEYELIDVTGADVGFNTDIKPPRALQYAAGYEQQIDPDIGFVRRPGTERLNAGLNVPVYLQTPTIRRFVPGFNSVFYRDQNGESQDSFQTASFLVDFQSGDQLLVFGNRNFERIPDEFSIFHSVTLLPGEYSWYDAGISLTTKPGRRLSGQLEITGGGLYDGLHVETGGFINWKINKYLTIGQSYSTNKVDLPTGAFRTHLALSRISYSLNTSLSVDALAQYDNESDQFGLNLRIVYIFREGTELFFVFNEITNESELLLSPNKRVHARSALLKFTYLFQW